MVIWIIRSWEFSNKFHGQPILTQLLYYPTGLTHPLFPPKHFLFRRILTLQHLLCRHWNPKFLAGLQYFLQFITEMPTISAIYVECVWKSFCYKYLYGNKFKKNKSDISIILFRFHQKGLSEITKPFYLRIWEKIVKYSKTSVF